MSDAFRGLNNAGAKGWERTYFPLKGSLSFWDMSASSGKNNRQVKLGVKDAVTGSAIFSYDASKARASIADGLGNTGYNSKQVLEPDCFALRLHTPGGKGYDNVWAVRIVCEHENPSTSRTHRSTMILDQCGSQNWAWLMDLGWVKDLGAAGGDPELAFDGAGFLGVGGSRRVGGVVQRRAGGLIGPDVATEDSGTKRAAFMLNISKRGGYSTDGDHVGQLWHVLSIRKVGATNATTVAGEKKCGEVTKNQLAVRGDLNFHMGTQLVHPAIAGGGPTAGLPAAGHLYIGAPSPAPPSNELSDDPKSNQPILRRFLEKGFRPIVFVPPPAPPPIDMRIPPYHPDGGDGGGGGGCRPDTEPGQFQPATPSNKCGTPVGGAPPGVPTGMDHGTVPLPSSGSSRIPKVRLPFFLDGLPLPGLFTMRVSLWYKIVRPNEEPPSSLTEMEKLVDPGTYGPTADTINQLEWVLPEVEAIGGHIVVWIMRHGDDAADTAPQTLWQYGPPLVDLDVAGIASQSVLESQRVS